MELAQTDDKEFVLTLTPKSMIALRDAILNIAKAEAAAAEGDEAATAALAADMVGLMTSLGEILSTDPAALIEAGQADFAVEMIGWAGGLAAGLLEVIGDTPGLAEMIATVPEAKSVEDAGLGQNAYFVGDVELNAEGAPNGPAEDNDILGRWGQSLGNAVQEGAQWVVENSDPEGLYGLDNAPDGDATAHDSYLRDPAPDGDERDYEAYRKDPAPDGEETAGEEPGAETPGQDDPGPDQSAREMAQEEARSVVDPDSGTRYFIAEPGEGEDYTDEDSGETYYIDRDQYESLKRAEAQEEEDEDAWEDEDWGDEPEDTDDGDGTDDPDSTEDTEPEDTTEGDELPPNPNVDESGGAAPEDLPDDAAPGYGTTQPDITEEGGGGGVVLKAPSLDPWILTDPDRDQIVYLEFRGPTYGLTQPDPLDEGGGVPEMP
ncbi:MAG: hypothetical protein AAGI70_15575, partial [Pseudomonadota bacterium]